MKTTHECSQIDLSSLPLMTANEVAKLLNVRSKRVYELGIPRVNISARSCRWRYADVTNWLNQRVDGRTA